MPFTNTLRTYLKLRPFFTEEQAKALAYAIELAVALKKEAKKKGFPYPIPTP